MRRTSILRRAQLRSECGFGHRKGRRIYQALEQVDEACWRDVSSLGNDGLRLAEDPCISEGPLLVESRSPCVKGRGSMGIPPTTGSAPSSAKANAGSREARNNYATSARGLPTGTRFLN